MQNIITSSPWIWTGLLATMVLLPVLIHLINRLRHRQVRWAAMEFLLASHRKNRNRVWLKQLLLLLARIAVLILILLTIGQVGCQNDNLARLTGERVTHHYVLVDDSLSMSETVSGQSAMERARIALGRIASRISGRNNQRLTVLRFSRARPMSGPGTAAAATGESAGNDDPLALADLNAHAVNRQIETTMQEVVAGLESTRLASGPREAVDLAAELIERRSGENAMVYILSDFRNGDWSNQAELGHSLTRYAASNAALELVRCTAESGHNLAITSLEPDGSVRVAGVPLMIGVQVRNFGKETARKVQIALTSATYPDTIANETPVELIEPVVDELSTILIDEIPPGESRTRRFPVFFGQPGQHAIRATLQPDAIAGDNRNWLVTRFSQADRVLVIDGPDSKDGQFMSLALSPGGMTGLQVEQSGKAILRDIEADELDELETIFLLDVDRLEENAIRRLRGFVERGGGVVFFTGPATNLKHYTADLYAAGNGLFPVPLQRHSAITEQLDEPTADISVTRHPVFAPVMDVDNSPLDLVQVQRVSQPPPEWSAARDPAVNVVASVRGQKHLPLMVEKKIGKGTVLAVLTTAGPQWNNWLRNPTFPATLLLIQDHVSRGRDEFRRQFAGSVREFRFSSSEYRPGVIFVSPGTGDFSRTSWEATALPDPQDPTVLQTGLGKSLSETARPGIYESWRTTVRSEAELERFALNVDNSESEPDLVSRADLLATLGETPAQIVNWNQFGSVADRNRGTSLVRLLLFLLLLGLVVEQVLAWSASWHPVSGRRRFASSTRPNTRASRRPDTRSVA